MNRALEVLPVGELTQLLLEPFKRLIVSPAVELGLSVPTVRKRLRQFVDKARRRLRQGFESQIMRAIQAEAVIAALLLPLSGLVS